MAKQRLESLREIASVSDGNHFGISGEFCEDGVPYYRGQDVVGHFFVEQSDALKITREAYAQPTMVRSHLRSGDVLLSIIGSIGEASLVSSNAPATCSCKLAILRPLTISAEYLATFLRSEFGRSQNNRMTRGAVQMGLLLEDADQLFVPRFSEAIEEGVAVLVRSGKQQFERAAAHLADAEQTLLRVLGLEDWRPPEPLTYVRSASEVVGGRLDAEFHQPCYQALEAQLASRFSLKPLGKLGAVLKGETVPYSEEGTVPIIRSGDLKDIDDDARFLRAAPGADLFELQRGDILISSIGFGSIGKVQVFDKPGLYGTVSEVTVIRQKELNPYYIAAFLRSRFGQMLIERHITGATGQLHLYAKDVAKIVIPILAPDAQTIFEQNAKAALAAKQGAQALLARAQRAVELAIEQGETAALALLAEPSGSKN